MAYKLTDEDRRLAQQMAASVRPMPVQQTAPTQQPKEKKGFLLDMLSAGTGAGGALGGAALGASLGSAVPGVGTAIGGIIGALLGGGAGSAAGEVAENAITGDDLMKNVGTEAALGGVTSLPFGAGLRLLRAGGRAAIGKAGAGELVQEAGMKTIGRGTVARMGTAGTLDDQANAALRRLGQGNAQRGVQSQGNRLNRLGSEMLASQAQITGREARVFNINPVKVIDNVNRRTGLTDLDDMATVSKALTGGQDSILDVLTREAIGSQGVKVPSLRSLAQDKIADYGTELTGSTRKGILDVMKNTETAMFGGSKGSLSTLADPNQVLDRANTLRKSASTLLGKATTTAADEQKARLYNEVARSLEDALYSAPQVAKNMKDLTRLGATSLREMAGEAAGAGRNAQARAFNQIADEVANLKSVKDLRSMKRDFMNVSRMSDLTEQARGARAFNGNDAMTQMRSGPIRGTITGALNLATPRIGGALSGAGRRVAGTSTSPTRVGQSLLGASTRQTAGRVPLLTGAIQTDRPIEATGELTQDAALVQGGVDPLTGATDTMSALGGQMAQEPSIGGITKSQLEQMMAMAAMEGNSDAFGQMQALYEMLPQETGGLGDLDAQSRRALAQSANAESTVAGLEDLFTQAGGAKGVVGGTVQGMLGRMNIDNPAQAYNQLSESSIAQLARAMGETGTMSDRDIEVYRNMIPRLTDTPEVAAAKFAEIRRRMQAAQQNTLMFGGGAISEEVSSEL